jgi:hypothetical protein
MPESGSGSRWTPEEEQRLVSSFDTGRTVDELARAHKRSRAAIEARLVRLGKMDASAVTSPLRYPPKRGARRVRARRPLLATDDTRTQRVIDVKRFHVVPL